jgi:hypothetical protein
MELLAQVAARDASIFDNRGAEIPAGEFLH